MVPVKNGTLFYKNERNASEILRFPVFRGRDPFISRGSQRKAGKVKCRDATAIIVPEKRPWAAKLGVVKKKVVKKDRLKNGGVQKGYSTGHDKRGCPHFQYKCPPTFRKI